MFKKIVKWFISIISIFILLILFVLLFFTLAPGEKFLKGVLESQLSETLDQNIIITSLETNLLTRLEIDGLYILENHKDSTVHVLYLDNLKIHYSLIELPKKKISIKSIGVSKLDVNFKRDSLGFYNLHILNSADTMAAIQTEESKYKLALNTLAIDTLITSYVDELADLNAFVKNCRVNIKHINEKDYIYNVNINEIKSVYVNIPMLIEDLALNGTISNEFFAIDNFKANFSGFNVIAAGRADLGIDTTIMATIKFEGNPELLLDTVLSTYSIPKIKFSKDISFSADIRGNLDSPLLFARLSIPEAQSELSEFDDLLLTLSYENDIITMDSLKVDVFNGIIKANGSAKVDSQLSGDANINIINIDMAQIWMTVYMEKSPYEGQINGQLAVVIPSENIVDWRIDSNLETCQGKYLGKILPDFSMNARLNNGFGKLSVHHPNFAINLNSAFGDSKIDGNYTIDILSVKTLAEILDIAEIDGTINASGRLGGTFESPEIDAHINAENMNYSNFPLDKLEADIRYKNDLLQFSKLNFFGQLDSINQLKLPFDIDSVSGSIIYNGWASGNLDNIKAGLDIELNNTRFGQWGIDHGRFHISANGKNIYIDSSYIEKNLQLLKVGGSYSIDDSKGKLNLSLFRDKSDTVGAGNISSDFHFKENEAFLLSMQGHDIDFTQLAAIYSDTLIAGGMLNFDLSLDSELNNIAGGLKIRAVDPMFKDVYIDSFIADISVFDEKLNVPKFELYKAKHILKSSGVLTLEQDSLGQLSVTDNCIISAKLYYDDWDMAILNPFLKERAEVSGISSLNIEFDGILSAPKITGSLEIDESDIILLPEGDSITSLSLQIAIDDSILAFNHFNGMINNIPFEISGNVTISNKQNYNSNLLFSIPDVGFMSAKGGYSSEKINLKLVIDDLDLSLLEPFVPSVLKLEGVLNSEVLVQGEVDNPLMSGDLLIRRFTFQPEIIPSLFTGGVIKIQFDKRTIILDSLYLKLNDGPLLISGFLAHENGEIVEMDFNAAINNLKINQPKEYEIHLHAGSLKYSGKREGFLLDGDLQFGESKLLTKIKAQSILPWARKVEKALPELPSILEQTKINVRIRESDKLWIDNNLAHIRLHSELGFIGSPIQPNITGRLSIDEGYILYLDRKFKVKRGIVFFNDPFRFNPEIDLLAEAQVKSYQALESQSYIIRIEISGDLDELTTEVYSEPPLDKTDIMALLTLGATRSQLSGKDTESGDVSTKGILLERAAMLSSQRISGYVSQRMGTFLGLDEVSVEGNLFKFDKSWGPQLLASKKLSEKMSLTYKTTVGHMNDQSIKLNYKLTRKFSLEGQTDRQGRSGLDLIYGLRFK